MIREEPIKDVSTFAIMQMIEINKKLIVQTQDLELRRHLVEENAIYEDELKERRK